jgi:hypothetical protein
MKNLRSAARIDDVDIINKQEQPPTDIDTYLSTPSADHHHYRYAYSESVDSCQACNVQGGYSYAELIADLC